jgi:hypothetical protein
LIGSELSLKGLAVGAEFGRGENFQPFDRDRRAVVSAGVGDPGPDYSR